MPNRRDVLIGGAAAAMLSCGLEAKETDDRLGFRHAVGFNFKPDVPEAERDGIIAALRDTATLPMVKKVVVGRDPLNPRPHARFTWMLMADFADRAAYKDYGAHPKLKAIDLGAHISESSGVNLEDPFQTTAKDPQRAAAKTYVRHTLMFNFLDRVPPAERERIIGAIKTVIAPNPYLQHFMIGRNAIPKGPTAAYEWFMVCDWISQADRDAFNKDDARNKVGAEDFAPNTDFYMLDMKFA